MTTPKLKSINGFFGLTDSQNSQTTYQADLFIEQLKPFHNPPFSLHTGERLDDLVDSIRVNGVMQPIIVQPKGRFYEILAGHNRANAAKLAGLETIPAVIVVDLSKEEALAYVIESNMMQRSFSELRYSEKAAVIALQHGKMFSQGKRSDIQAALLELTEGQKKRASSLDKTKLRTNENIASQYDLSKNTIARYLRINKLCISLKEKLDEGRIAFTPAVNVSFLTVEEQECLNACLSENKQKLDLLKTEQLHASSKEGYLTREQQRDENGHVKNIEYNIFEEPIDFDPDNPYPEPPNHSNSPKGENPAQENHPPASQKSKERKSPKTFMTKGKNQKSSSFKQEVEKLDLPKQENQGQVNPVQENPVEENRRQINKELINTKIINTKGSSTYPSNPIHQEPRMDEIGLDWIGLVRSEKKLKIKLNSIHSKDNTTRRI